MNNFFPLYLGIGLAYAFTSPRFEKHRKVQKTISIAFIKGILLFSAAMLFPILIFLDIFLKTK